MASQATSRKLTEAELNSPDINDDGEVDVEKFLLPNGDGIENESLRQAWDEAKRLIECGEAAAEPAEAEA